MSGHTAISWGYSPITRRCESGGRVTPENTDQSSIVFTCGGNAEIDLLTLVVGRFVDDAQASDPPQERKLPISVIIGAFYVSYGSLDLNGHATDIGKSPLVGPNSNIGSNQHLTRKLFQAGPAETFQIVL